MIKNSVVKRWSFTVLSVIIAVIIIISVAFCLFLKNQYYDTVRMTLNSRATSMVVSNLTSSTPVSDETFYRNSRNFVNNFSDKNIMEVWVIDKNDNIVVSSSGFSVKGEPYPDYDLAKASENGKGEWIGKTQSGEKVMALTYILPQNENSYNGAVRYIISLEDVDKQLVSLWALIGLFAVLVIFLVFISGAFFIRSIINPVTKINETASKIAKGDFNVSIEKHKYNDEIGQLCDTINHMAHEISETERLKNEFISTVSHELRTPLTAIKGWGETIRLAKDTDEEIIDKGINIIVNESERLTVLVGELLDFSRMESGKMSLKITSFDIVKVMSEVLDVFLERSEREGIELKTKLPNYPIKISGDPNRLRQAFVNLIDNSFKYNKKGGYVEIVLEQTKKNVVISIVDNGCGISKNDLPRVKEKFYKANNSVRGTGIGLAVTDEIVKLHKGELIIDSKIGHGTKITMLIPKSNN